MRKFVLVAAMVLASATAQAGVSRGLTVASSDEPAAAVQPKSVETPKPAEAPTYVARPAAVDTTTDAPKVDQARPGPERYTRAGRSRHRHASIQGRIIYARHRYGIYW
jgi:hypothetical protein